MELRLIVLTSDTVSIFKEKHMTRIPRPMLRILVCVLLAVLVIAPFAMGSRTLASPASAISLSSSVQVSFPTSITFKVSAQSDVNIVKLRLHYIVDRQNYASVISEGWAQFNPATTVDTQWVWDMRQSGGLPPGTQVEYWWTAEDATGKTTESNRSTASFDDDRYEWQSITTGSVTLLWYNGDRSFADALMTAAQQGLQKIEQDIGATPEGHVRIYIYASAQDMQGATLFPEAWEGGVTFEGYNTIAIGVSTSQLDFGEGAVPHELTHWVIHHLTFNSYGAGLPTWLDEGLATYIQNEQDSDWLNSAIRENKLISIRTLSSPFSAITEQAQTSYAESHSIVTFLLQTYGKEKMLQLLNVFHQGSGYDDALKQVYGFDQDGLNALWLQSIGVKTTASASQRELVLAGTAK
jgi:hypothetical protein